MAARKKLFRRRRRGKKKLLPSLTGSFEEAAMPNSFLSMETISRALYAQQLTQNVIASNLSKTYQDSNGYLMGSRQRVDLMEGSPLLFGNMGGIHAVGTGPIVQQITRLRSSFLDSQIQVESSVLGRAEILTDLLAQINGVVNGSSGTLDNALTDLGAAFTALAANPLNIALRSTVVNDGVAFATLARNQYTQLENFQKGLNGKINQTVTDINQILQQLASFNRQLVNSHGANVNDLLDVRDYALDRLSRLVNIQVNFGSSGTVDVYLGGSSFSLVDSAGASIIQTNVMNPHNPGLSDVTIQSSHGTIWTRNAASYVTGGNLAGELHARDVVLESYKTQIDQIATSVLSVTNYLHRSGYAADGTTTQINFFTGTGARDINVNASLVTDPTRALLAASSRLGVPANGQIAQFIGNVRNLLANNFIESRPAVAPAINPNGAITQFTTPPSVGGGSFTVNGVTVNWLPTDTIYQVLDKINAADPNVEAVFNVTERRFYMFSDNPINIVDTGGNFTASAQINNVLVSTIRMNNGFAPTDPKINFLDFGTPAADDMNSTLPGTIINNGPNSQAFRVIPGVSGSFTINGYKVAWDNTMSLSQVLGLIAAGNGAGAFPGTFITPFFDQNPANPTYQMLTIFSATFPRPIQIIDNTGNFTVFTGLNGNTPIGNISSGVLTNVASDLAGHKLTQDQSAAALGQLNTAQANIGGISTIAGQPGVPIQVEQENAMKSLIAFNASLQVLQIINQMYADLVGIIGPPSGNTLQPRV
jgi:flagellar hook-associated protein FlgK